MPKGSNKFYAKDRIAVAKNVSKVIDPKKAYIGDFVSDAQRWVFDNKISPGEPKGDNVVYIAPGKDGTFARIYYDGHAEPIDEETYKEESIYNFLPNRFKTYRPGG